MSEPDPTKMHWLLRPATIRKLWIGGIALLVVVAVLDMAIHKHAYFGVDGTFGFYSWYGFLTCVAMIVFAKVLGVILKRGDDYYERD